MIITLQPQEATGNVLQTGLDGHLLDPDKPMQLNGSDSVVEVVTPVVVVLLEAAVLPILVLMEHAALNMVIAVLLRLFAELDVKQIVDLSLPEAAVLPDLALMAHAALNMDTVVLVRSIAEPDAKPTVTKQERHFSISD